MTSLFSVFSRSDEDTRPTTSRVLSQYHLSHSFRLWHGWSLPRVFRRYFSAACPVKTACRSHCHKKDGKRRIFEPTSCESEEWYDTALAGLKRHWAEHGQLSRKAALDRKNRRSRPPSCLPLNLVFTQCAHVNLGLCKYIYISISSIKVSSLCCYCIHALYK